MLTIFNRRELAALTSQERFFRVREGLSAAGIPCAVKLRGLANSIDTILQVGKDGLGENLIKQADDALEARELIKGRVLDNNIEYDARLAAEELARATRSEVVQVIGTKFVLYRESHSKPRDKRIQLAKPARGKTT